MWIICCILFTRPIRLKLLEWNASVSVISLNLLAFNCGNFPGLKCVWNGSSPWKCPERRPLNLLFDAVGNFCLKSYIYSRVDVAGVTFVMFPVCILLLLTCCPFLTAYVNILCTVPENVHYWTGEVLEIPWITLSRRMATLFDTDGWLTVGAPACIRLCQMCLGLRCGTRHGNETISCWNGAGSWVGFYRPDVTCHHPVCGPWKL